MKNKVLAAVCGILMLSSSLRASDSLDEKRILVLNSYTLSYSWSRDVIMGLYERLGEEGVDIRKTKTVFYNSVDIRSEELAERRSEMILDEIRDLDFDLIIAQDDFALHRLIECYEELFLGIPIVFSGISEGFEIPELMRPYTTGVFERTNAGQFIKDVTMCLPNLKEIYLIHGANSAAMGIRNSMEKYFDQIREDHTLHILDGREHTAEEILDFVAKLPDDGSAVVLSLGWKYGRDLRPFRFHKPLSIASSAPVVLFEQGEFSFPNESSLMAVAVIDGMIHGRLSGDLVLRVLNGESPEQIPYIDGYQASYVFSEKAISRWSIMTKDLPPRSTVELDSERIAPRNLWIYVLFAVLTAVILVAGYTFYRYTKQKNRSNRLERERGQLASLLGGIRDIVLVIDTKGILVYANNVASKELGYSKDELLQLKESELLVVVDSHYLIKTHAGDWITAEADVSEVLYSGLRCKLWVFRDIREVIKREEELISTKNQLELANERLTKALKNSRENEEKATKANEAKNLFLANMSHEIRSPLNAVIGLSEAVEESVTSEENRSLLKLVRESGVHLLSLVNDILDFSKIEAEELILESSVFDLKELIKYLDRLYSALALEKGLEFELNYDSDIPKALKGDPARLRQILINLLDNSMKFTEKGFVRISVKLAMLREDSCDLSWEVQDSGIGISSKAISNLFSPFVQADLGTSRKYGGTGLGLSITRRLVEMMGGRIIVDSTKGVGTKFSFTTQLEVESGEVFTSPVRDLSDISFLREDGSSYRVLIVDDSQTNQMVAKRCLKRLEFESAVVSSAKEAFEALDTEEFDIVFMDIQMPEIDGYEATEIINKRGPTQKNHGIPIVALTANAMRSDVQKSVDAGMSGYLSKPISLSRMREVLAEVIGIIRSH